MASKGSSGNCVGLDDLALVWLEEDNLMLLECWARDGYTFQDISTRIGITHFTLARWRKKYPEIEKALKQGREIIDYKVENALLKAALGYKTKEVRVTTTYKDGIVTDLVTEKIEKEQAPNVYAIQSWLYNRLPDKWKKNRDNVISIGEEDSTLEITVTRAPLKQTDDTDDEINTGVSVKRKPASEPSEQIEEERLARETSRDTSVSHSRNNKTEVKADASDTDEGDWE